MIQGIDISFAQGAVNIQTLLNQFGAEFVSIRAGYGGATAPDNQFVANRDHARALNIPRMFYFYAYPGRSSGAQQAEAFHQFVGDLQAGESIALDIEDDVTYGRALIASDVQWCLEFLNRCVELFGVKPLIYMNTSVKGRFDWTPVQKADYGLWQANYGVNDGAAHTQPDPSPWAFNALWQYTSKPLDRDLFNGDVNQFLKYGKSGSTPAPTPAPAPAPTPPPAPQPQGTTYTVKSGDTLSGIAAKYGTTYQKIAADNGIADPNKIYPGQVLKINGGGSAPSTVYTVKSGDTLSGIATKYGTTYQHLAQINGIADPNKIYPGQQIKIA
jgi:LysM repeat protein/GH25 family lysozyme M1 (1,4-beta-N-acetylmuramidase)